VNRIGQNQKENVKPNTNENKENQNDMFALNFVNQKLL